ncbi:MAG: hypothetical protein HZA90_25170 [Verrucomicrobia bacterium]|nr:hypothetical protein [Verrucomicrobiota bacterium]
MKPNKTSQLTPGGPAAGQTETLTSNCDPPRPRGAGGGFVAPVLVAKPRSSRREEAPFRGQRAESRKKSEPRNLDGSEVGASFAIRHSSFVILTLLLTLAAPLRAQTISTIAGGGASTAEGVDALAALLNVPQGVVVDAAGNIAFADQNHNQVRWIEAATGTIRTLAGTNFAATVDDFFLDGAAAAAPLNHPSAVALDAAGRLYIADTGLNRIRRVDLLALPVPTISTVAGTQAFGYNGDGILATTASLSNPNGVAVDAAGHLYIADTSAARVRKVDATAGLIATLAGNGSTAYNPLTDEGVAATSVGVGNPKRVAVDSAGHVFVLHMSEPDFVYRVRRIDATTGIITTVAGGGGGAGTSGLATDANLGTAADLAVDTAGHLYIAGQFRVWKVVLATGDISVVAGTGASGFSGDGGDAILATFAGLGGVAAAANGDLIVSDTGNQRLRRITAPAPADVVVDENTPQATLNALTTVTGNLIVDATGRTSLSLPNLTAVGGNFVVANNGQLLTLDVAALATVGGSVNLQGNGALTAINLNGLSFVGGSLVLVGNSALTTLQLNALAQVVGTAMLSGNPVLASVCLPALQTVGGSLDVSDNPAATTLCFPVLLTVGGDLSVNNNTAATDASFPSLTATGGSVQVSNDPNVTGVNFPALVTTGGSVEVSNDPSATSVSFPELATTGGSVEVSNDPNATNVSFPSLTSTGGSVQVSNDTAATSIGFPSLTQTGSSVTVSDNASATVVDFTNLENTGGSVTLSNNPVATTVTLTSLTNVDGSFVVVSNTSVVTISAPLQTVGGDVVVTSNTGATTVDVGGLTSVGGSVDVSSNTGATTVNVGGLTSAGGDVVVSSNTGATTVDVGGLTTAGGSVEVSSNTSATTVDVGGLASAGGDVVVTSNTGATVVDVGGLTSAGGDVTVSDNANAAVVDFTNLENTGGSVTISNNPAATTVTLTSLTNVDGSFVVVSNASVVTITAPLQTVGGDVTVNGNTSTTTVDMGNLSMTGGSVTVNGNTSATSVSFPSLATTGGGLTVNGDTSATSVSFPSLTNVDGSITVNGDTSATSVSFPSLATTGGDVTVNGDTSATSVSFPSLTNVTGSITVNGDTSATSVSFPSLTTSGSVTITNNPNATLTLGDQTAGTTVGGDLTIESAGGSVDLSGTTVTGDVTVTGNGTTTLSASTSASTGTTAVTLLNAEAALLAALPNGAFASRVGFTVEHLPPATLPLVQGVDANNQPVEVDPVAAYQFTFAIPTLNADATLLFEIEVGALSPADQAAFLAAVASGAATLAVKNDTAGSLYQTYPVCGPGQTASGNGCVEVFLFDANGAPLPPGSPAPATVRFVGVTGHFSTFAVVIATPLTPPPQPLPAAPSALVAALWFGPKVVLGFWDNATNETGFAVERAVNGGAFTTLATLGPKAGRGLVSYTDTGVAPGSSYAYRVKAVNGAGGSAWSNTARVSVPVVPAAPSAVKVAVARRTTLTVGLAVGWKDNSANNTSFTIQVATDSAFTRIVVPFVVGPNATTLNATLPRGPAYYVRVRSDNGLVSSGWVNATPFPVNTR